MAFGASSRPTTAVGINFDLRQTEDSELAAVIARRQVEGDGPLHGAGHREFLAEVRPGPWSRLSCDPFVRVRISTSVPRGYVMPGVTATRSLHGNHVPIFSRGKRACHCTWPAVDFAGRGEIWRECSLCHHTRHFRLIHPIVPANWRRPSTRKDENNAHKEGL